MAELVLQLKKINKYFGKNHVIKNVDLEFEKGHFITFLGPSGCGKTTLLRMIAGFYEPDDGEILLNDKNIERVPPYNRNTAMVFQEYALFPHMNVFENVSYGLRVKHKPAEEIKKRVTEALSLMQLSGMEKRFPNQMSGGQQQRVAVARALVMDPELLLLDEPLSNLDAKLRESMRFEIKELQRKLGVTVVYVTHDQAEAMAMSDRIIVMYKGVIQQIDVPTQIYEHPANPTVADFIGLVNFLEGEAEPGVIHFNKLGCSLPVEVSFTGPARVAVRPEHITMSKTSGPLRGKLLHKIYLGDSTDWRIAVGDTVLRVIDRGLSFDEYVDGEEVFLSFGHVMAFPK